MSDIQEEVQQEVLTQSVDAPASTESVVPQSTPVIYCGPTLPRQYGLTQYQVFSNGLPVNVAQAVSDCASIGALLVPVADFAATRLAISKKGSGQWALYQEIIKFSTSKVVNN